jgi:phosphinothricin acetyltransferase
MIEPASVSAPCTVRDAAAGDMPAVTALYAHYVRTSLATFEEVPPTVAEMNQRRDGVAAAGLPFLVATDGANRVVGYAYAAAFRTRSAYRFALEDSIYVDQAAARRGVGLILLTALIERCAALGYRQMVAVIGDTDNAPSIGLHEKAGFQRVGMMPAVGFKLGRWVDSVLMQRALDAGSAAPPKPLGTKPN